MLTRQTQSEKDDGRQLLVMTACNASRLVIRVGIALTFIQIVIAGHGQFLGSHKMLISTLLGVAGIVMLVTGIVMDNKLKPNSSVDKSERILAIFLLVGSVTVISLALLGTTMMGHLFQSLR